MAAKQLTAKQRLFALEYVICKNGTEAARRAGYEGDDVTLASVAYENLRKPHIREFIETHFAEHAMRAHEVIDRLSEQAAADIGDFMDIRHNWATVDLEKAKKQNKLHLIKKIKQGKYGIELELHDAQAAQRTLAQHHGLLKSEVVINFAPELLERFSKLADRANMPASQLFEDMMNAIAAELESGGAAGR